jgi:negative regulator of sigma-B (phosphoserine phosphatase)
VSKVDCHLSIRPLLGEDSQCGDIGLINEFEGHCFVALVDVLGHGAGAYEVALMAKQFLAQHCHEALEEVMQGLHLCLKGTRGAVAALCRLHLATGCLSFVGVGNISTRVLGPHSFRLVPRDGIVGYMMMAPKEQTAKLYAGDLLVMHSDGIKENFDTLECAGLLRGTAKSIASGLLNQFGKKEDDASCLVLRYYND